MALIKCPECGKEISDKAGKCPNCGYPLKAVKKEEKSRDNRLLLLQIVNITMAVFGGFMLLAVISTGMGVFRNLGAMSIALFLISAAFTGIYAIRNNNRNIAIASAIIYFITIAISLKMLHMAKAYLLLEFACGVAAMLTAICFKSKRNKEI